jgi:hypothetical protein
MNISILAIGLALAVAAPVAVGDSAGDRSQGPCFDVTVQNQSVNHARVEQKCDRNFNRTTQAGRENTAHTVQTGSVNNNKTRQYHYDPAQYLERMGGR